MTVGESSSRFTALTNLFIAIAIRCGTFLARFTPRLVVAFVVKFVVPVICIGLRRQRAMVAKHLKRVDPKLSSRQVRRLVQKAYVSYASYYIETFRLPYLSKNTIANGIQFEQFKHIDDALGLGKGVILCLPHLGGWEWSGRWVIQHGYTLNAVVEKLDSPQVFEMFLNLRRNYGVKVIPLDDRAGIAVQAALANNELVALLCDRDLQGNGVDVQFFGETTKIPAGPAFFALRTGASIVPLGAYFEPKFDQHRTVVFPALEVVRRDTLREDVNRISQEIANSLEILIRRAPHQWHLFQPNWPSDITSKQ